MTRQISKRIPPTNQAEEQARCEMMLLLREYPGPCGRKLLEEKGDTSWVDTLAEAHRRIALKLQGVPPPG